MWGLLGFVGLCVFRASCFVVGLEGVGLGWFFWVVLCGCFIVGDRFQGCAGWVGCL